MALYTALRSAVDWITASGFETDEGVLPLYDIAKRGADDYVKQYGVLVEPWYFYGYKGFVVRSNGHLAYGERYGEKGGKERRASLIQSSGAVSDRLWKEVVRSAENVSRIDLCVDVSLREADQSIAQVCYDYLQEPGVKKGTRKTTLWTSTRGSTLYIGSRRSTHFGRLYDKSGEMGLERGKIWRYEIELKGVRAKQMAEGLLQIFDEGKGVDGLGETITKTVYRWYQDRMVEPLFEISGKGVETLVLRATTSLEEKLTWLRTQVAPTVAKLLSAGYGAEVFSVLGLATLDDWE